MFHFTYYTPTKVVFGADAEEQIGALVRDQGCRKVLIHYGGGSAERSGLLGRIEAALEREGIAWVKLGGVVPNPRLSLVYQGIGLVRQEGVDFILAVGGGSVIDSAKAIAYGAAEEEDVWELYAHTRQAKACLPVGAVLTIAAAGSEMSESSVITKDEGGVKRGYNNDLARPKFAVMNPDLTLTLPPYQTASGCVDILMHTMERYFAPEGNMEVTDRMAEGLMRTVLHNAEILRRDPGNREARAEVMWAGSLSHNGLMGNQPGDWNAHGLEHEMGGMFDVTHGAGLAAIWGSWARYVYQACPERFARFGAEVLGVSREGTPEETALRGIEAMEDFYRSIGMPTCFSELGIAPTREQMETMARMCAEAAGGGKGAIRVLGETDYFNIYQLANH